MINRLLVTILACVGLVMAADDLPKGEAVLDKYVEVTGGKAAYEKVHSEVVKGTMEFAGRGIKGALTSYQTEPAKEYMVVDLEGVGKVESGGDGDVCWERSALAGPRLKTGDEREEVVRASVFNPHLNWRKMYEKAETTGIETAEGEECYKVVLTPRGGKPVTEFYSKKTGLLVKETSVHSTSMGDIAAENVMKDYKPVSGLQMPFTRISRFAGQEIQVHVDSIEFNSIIPKDKFDLPDEIKALVRKNGATDEKK